ncbi:hypothetical protein [Sphaerothrix gracilis]
MRQHGYSDRRGATPGLLKASALAMLKRFEKKLFIKKTDER